ncbi:MAG: FtsQ-type POTRA domain-containing protein [bacterium]|nr:FtsQ-type POTRA domain-containing protein [bacterium]
MNAKILKKRKKPPNFSPFTREKAIRWGLILVILATCGFGGLEVGRYLLADAKYAVKHIVVRGNQKLSSEEIIKVSSLKKGENILRCRIHHAKERLGNLPLVEHAAVSRFMPDIIVIEVVERVPRARLAGKDELLTDYAGVILPPSAASGDPGNLPAISGIDTEGLAVGERFTSPGVMKALRVLRLWESSALSDLAEVEAIDCSRADNLRLCLKPGLYTKEGFEAPIGGDGFELKLAKLESILRSVIAKHHKKVQWLDLTQENVPVRF